MGATKEAGANLVAKNIEYIQLTDSNAWAIKIHSLKPTYQKKPISSCIFQNIYVPFWTKAN